VLLMPKAAGSPSANDIEANAIVCRICLDHEDTPSNPLLRPCRCRGSMAYVHRNCLNEWRRQSIHPNSIYQCDTCKFEYRFATAIRPDRFTIARVLAWPISIHLLSVMGLFWLCFAGGFVAKLFDASLTWSDFNLINLLLRGATAIGTTVSCLLLLTCLLLREPYMLVGVVVLHLLVDLYKLVGWAAGKQPYLAVLELLGREDHSIDKDIIKMTMMAVVYGLGVVYLCWYFWIENETVRLSARAAAAAQHVVLDVGGHDDEEDGEANRGSFDGGEDKEHGNVNAPHPLERQQLIARP